VPDVPEWLRLLQSLDSTRFHHTSDRNANLIQARTETLISLLYGETIALPPAQFADSLGLFQIACEIIDSCPRDFNLRNREFPLFGICIESDYQSIKNFILLWWSNELIHSSVFSKVAVKTEEQFQVRRHAIKELSRLKPNWLEFDKITGFDGLGYYLNTLTKNFDQISSINRLYTGYKRIDYTLAIQKNINLIGAEVTSVLVSAYEEEIKHLSEGVRCLEAKNSSGLRPFMRSGYYDIGPGIFEEYWDLVRSWIDEAYTNVHSKAFQTDAVTFSTEKLIGTNYPFYEYLLKHSDKEILRGTRENTSCIELQPCMEIDETLSTFRWEDFWYVIKDGEWHKSVWNMREAWKAQDPDLLQTRFDEHTQLIANMLPSLTYKKIGNRVGTIEDIGKVVHGSTHLIDLAVIGVTLGVLGSKYGAIAAGGFAGVRLSNKIKNSVVIKWKKEKLKSYIRSKVCLKQCPPC
jgi:hypothetical protein